MMVGWVSGLEVIFHFWGACFGVWCDAGFIYGFPVSPARSPFELRYFGLDVD